MNFQEKAKLSELISGTEAEDHTQEIRETRRSLLLLENIRMIESLKRKESYLRKTDVDAFKEMCRIQCRWMFDNFTDIFNKLVVDEINLAILLRMVKVLQQIENGELDQHEGSVSVGKFLKEMYVDSALRRAEKIDKENERAVGEVVMSNANEGRKISWLEYKNMIDVSEKHKQSKL